MQLELPRFIKSWFNRGEKPDNLLKKYHNEDWHTPQGRQIREVVFGMNDGLVSTVGFVAGVTGSISESRIVLLTGMASIMAGAISMAMGGYLASKSQKEFFEKERNALKVSIAIALIALFGLGVGKTALTRTHWLKSSLEVVILGSLAAGVGYILGWVFSVTL